MNSDPQAKIALITGATRGIGFETARQLGIQGVRILLGARDPEKGEDKAAELRDQGLDVQAIEIDLDNIATIARAARWIASERGRLDILVNNAGIMLDHDGPPSEANLSAVRTILDTNFIATLAVTQAMLPLLRRSSAGRIVNVSSTLGSLAWNGGDNQSSSRKFIGYAASKAALNMLTVQLAYELRDTPIKVNSICPGFVKTDINKGEGISTVEEGATASVRYALIGDDGPSGGFFTTQGLQHW